jgi:hypothetical protein
VTKLEQIEQLRQELVKRIVEITGIPVGDFEVEVSFHNQGSDSLLAEEAHQLRWYPDANDGPVWFTSAVPTAGSVTVFIEEEVKIEDDPPHAGDDW